MPPQVELLLCWPKTSILLKGQGSTQTVIKTSVKLKSMVSGRSLNLSMPVPVPDVSFIAENISAAVSDSCAHLKLPWETGIYKDLFSHDPLSGFAVPSAFEPWVGEVPSTLAGVADSGEFLGCPPSAPGRSHVNAGKLFLDVPDVPYEARVAKIREEALIKLVA